MYVKLYQYDLHIKWIPKWIPWRTFPACNEPKATGQCYSATCRRQCRLARTHNAAVWSGVSVELASENLKVLPTDVRHSQGPCHPYEPQGLHGYSGSLADANPRPDGSFESSVIRFKVFPRPGPSVRTARWGP